ncbi:EpsG family protein, partial [Rodentibacter heidelbergensis]|uniref:EpsG family protein n=1 Tax=Rodentibacter heidelbergensis TaxID=1908258 RepID=UPI001FC94749
IAYYAFSYIYDNKLFRYFILVILSTAFHKIAVILLPVYFLVKKNYSVLFLLTIVFLSLAISYFDFIGIAIKYLFDRFPDIGAIRRVYHYYFNAHDPNLKISFIAYFQRVIVLVVLLLFYKKLDPICANILILYICSYFIFSNVGVMASRVSGMFLVSYVMFFPKLIYNFKIRNNSIIVLLYVVIFSFSMVVKDVQKRHPIYDRFTYLPYQVYPFFN